MTPEQVEQALRREWWLNHGHDYSAMYGDDGEMQCNACAVDFKRAPLDELRQVVFVARAIDSLIAEYEEWEAEAGPDAGGER